MPATSSALPSLPSDALEDFGASHRRAAGDVGLDQAGVTQFTRNAVRPSSRAMALARPSTPALAE